jgi:phosphate starvation-inducible protein PhoH and related proteins
MNRTDELLRTRAIDIEATELLRLFGPLDADRKTLEQRFGISLVSRGGQLLIRGPEDVIDRTTELIQARLAGEELPPLNDDEEQEDAPVSAKGHPVTGSPSGPVIVHTNNRTPISARSKGQKRYCEAIAKHDIVFGIGPAGTGKTYLAVANAVAALKKREINRLILTRPAVEAGENLGFLPGDLREKVDPYLRPLYDALYEMVAPEKLKQAMETHSIEIVPLAFMRGRTLNNAFVILDEAQNTTITQMKMFLTRLGADSKAVITGDVTQTDLPVSMTSGLADAREILTGIRGIEFVNLTDRDVVRHRLVQQVIRAYDRAKVERGNGVHEQ